jgi:hypothetical protein
MDPELLKFAAQMGATGLLAYGMFLVYRKDMAGNAESLKQHLDIERGRSDILIQVVKANTEVNAKLCEKLDRVIDERTGTDRRHG